MIDQFIDWFNNENINTEYLQVRWTSQSGYGLYLKKPVLQENTLIISIPQRLFLLPSNEIDTLNGFEQLIEYLIQNDEKNLYLKLLRSIDPVPKWRKSNIEHFPIFIKDKIKVHQEKFSKSRSKFVQYDDSIFEWAYYIVNTRSFYYQINVHSKDSDNNLCLIPFLDFINHSIEPNTICSFNPQTNSYELRNRTRIQSLDEQITFTYNQHSNVDLFIEYGFTLTNNIYNNLNISNYFDEIFSQSQIERLKSHNYWQNFDFYSGDYELPWTIIKTIELIYHENDWSPDDETPVIYFKPIQNTLKHILNKIQIEIRQQFNHWTDENLTEDREQIIVDISLIIKDTFNVIEKLTNEQIDDQ